MRQDLIAGLDEVGMGAIAGPIVVVVTAFWTQTGKVEGVNDSKKLSPEKREALFPGILAATRWLGVGFALPEEVDRLGVQRAWQQAAAIALHEAPEFKDMYVDGQDKVEAYRAKQTVKPKADALYWQCSAASVVAKVIRDRDMTDLSKFFKHYYWEHNAGYGTNDHMKGIQKYGASAYHRKEFIKETRSKVSRDDTTLEMW